MDLEPIEERANEFATWVGKFDSAHRIPAAFASAADVPALLAEAKHYRAQRDEWFLMESRAREAAEAEVVLLRKRIRKARHQRDEARAEASAQGTTQREPFLCFADAVLDLLHGRSEAEVKAEFDSETDGYTATRHQREVGTGYFYHLAAEGGADRG